MLFRKSRVLMFLLVLVLALTGCAGKSQKKSSAASYAALMQQAEQSLKAGQREKAIVQFKEMTKSYPTAKGPWQKLSQIHFDDYHYGASILAAEQVLRLDPNDKVGNSLSAVAGLRVSTSALATLRKRNALVGNVKAEATSLAALLRENIGEDVLVPSSGVRKTVKKTKKRRVKRQAKRQKKKAKIVKKKSGENVDPFASLE